MTGVQTSNRIAHPQVAATSLALNGGEAVAYAMRQIDPEVVAAYPITPQTVIIEKFAEYIANGEVQTEFVTVESEHAALSACVGASAAGARSITATAGPGLALMFEMLGVASGMRLPVVMHLCTRSLSSPINILGDHSDAMAMRETGWVMLSGSNPQEAYDQAVLAHLIAEHEDVSLPTASLVDGFVVTHSVERVDPIPDGAVKELLGEYSPAASMLDVSRPSTFGALDFRDYYYEHKRQQQAALEAAERVADSAFERFAQVSGRRYGFVEPYRLSDAEIAIVVMGSAEGAVRAAIDKARENGVRAGMLRVRLLRPFPKSSVGSLLQSVPVVGIMDQAIGFGSVANPLAADVMNTLWDEGARPALKGFVYGLGGRVLSLSMANQALDELTAILSDGDVSPGPTYLGLREGGHHDA